MYGTCGHCGATCVRVYLPRRTADEGLCATCVGSGVTDTDDRLTPSGGSRPFRLDRKR